MLRYVSRTPNLTLGCLVSLQHPTSPWGRHPKMQTAAGNAKWLQSASTKGPD